MDREAVKSVLRGQEIELPSWAFGNSGTRVFIDPVGHPFCIVFGRHSAG